jgi:hypothetical protein
MAISCAYFLSLKMESRLQVLIFENYDILVYHKVKGQVYGVGV